MPNPRGDEPVGPERRIKSHKNDGMLMSSRTKPGGLSMRRPHCHRQVRPNEKRWRRVMVCSELMKSEPVCVLPDTAVQTAAQRMSDENIGFLPVCDASGKVLGTLTDRDIAVRVVAKALPATTRVADVMTCEVVACRADEDIQQAE